MAGEYLMVDIDIWNKPEVQELVDITGTCVDSVVARLQRMWGWASLHTADGVIRATPERLARLHGGDAAYWLAVETVGWLKFDAEAGTMTVSNWERRFSKAAKARAVDRNRKSVERDAVSGDCPDSVRDSSGPNRTETGPEERRGEVPPPPPRARDGEQAGTRAEEIVLAWTIAAKASGGRLAPFEAKKPPAAIWDRLADPAWAEQALAAIERLPRCRYFDSPPTLDQLCGVKRGVTFAERVLSGHYDGPKNAKAAAGATDGRPNVQAAVERFEKRDPARDAMVREYQQAKSARKARA